MKFGRKLPAAAAVIGLAAGLTLVGPSSAGAQGQTVLEMGCAGLPGSEAETLIVNSGVFPSGIVPIPVTITADVPADLSPGQSGNVSFSWTLNPGDELADLAINVGTINSIDANLMTTGVAQLGGSGGPYPFVPQNTTLQLQPSKVYPTITASGQVTAGSDPISYGFEVGRLDLDLITGGTPQLMELDCSILSGSNFIAGTSVGGVAPDPSGEGGGEGGGSGSGSGGGASTTIGRGNTGTASARVTG